MHVSMFSPLLLMIMNIRFTLECVPGVFNGRGCALVYFFDLARLYRHELPF